MKRQFGLSMISLMVGLMLGLLSTVAAMALFRSVVQNAVGAQDSLAQDTVVSSAMLTAQLEIQRAGYGIGDVNNNCAASAEFGPAGAANADLRLLSGASLSGARVDGTGVTIAAAEREGNALLWQWRNEVGVDQCGGLLSVDGGLQLLQRADCAGLVNLAAINWTVTPLIPASRLAGVDEVVFAARGELCWPYQKAAPVTGVVMRMSAGNSSAALQTAYSICLPNICR